jgi:hypothetical protein
LILVWSFIPFRMSFVSKKYIKRLNVLISNYEDSYECTKLILKMLQKN